VEIVGEKRRWEKNFIMVGEANAKERRPKVERVRGTWPEIIEIIIVV